MKITKSRLKRIIKEELHRAIKEGAWDDIKGTASAVMSKFTGKEHDKELGLKLNDLRGAMEEIMGAPTPPTSTSDPLVMNLVDMLPREGGAKNWGLSSWVDNSNSVADDQKESFNTTTKALRLLLRAIADGSAGEGGEGFGPAWALWQANPSDGSWGLP